MAFITTLISLTVLSFLLLPYMLFTCNFSFEFCSRNLHSENDNATAIDEEPGVSTWNLLYHQPYFYYSFFNGDQQQVKYQEPAQLLSGLRFDENFPLVYLFVSMACQLGLSLYMLRHLVVLIKVDSQMISGIMITRTLISGL